MNKLFRILSIVAILALFAGLLMRVGQAFAAPKNLPYGLTLQDTMASVEQKLGQPRVMFAPQAGWEAGLPDAGGSPDHLRYWAVYRRFGVTIVYNTPSLMDKNATIYDIIVDE